MSRYITAILLLVFSKNLFECGQLDTSLCTPGGEESEMPPLPKYFSTNIQINAYNEHNNEGFGRFVTEMFDQSSGPRGKLVETMYFNQKELIYDFNKQRVITLNKLRHADETKCHIKKMEKSDEKFQVGDVSFLTPVAIMRKIMGHLEDTEKFYKQIGGCNLNNGLVADCWKSCFYDNLRNSTFLINYYWTNNSRWTPTGCNVANEGSCESVPARLDISEKSWFYSDRASVMRQVFDFSNFIQKLPSVQDLEAPKNIYCEGGNKTKLFPILPHSFSLSAEQLYFHDYDDIPDLITYNSIQFDADSNLSYVTDGVHLSVVVDAKNGVQYTKYVQQGTCQVSKFENDRSTLHFMTFQNVTLYNQLFSSLDLSNKTYSYNGKYFTRGVPSHAFVGKETHKNRQLIIEWYFEAKENEIGAPMKIVRRFADGGSMGRYEMHVTSWRPYQNLTDVFDVVECFKSNQTRLVRISFTVVSLAMKMKEPYCRNQLKVHLGKFANVRTQRIGALQIKASTFRNFEARFELLGRVHFDDGTSPSNSSPESGLNEALNKLQVTFSNHKLEMTIHTESNQTFKIRATSVAAGIEEVLIKVPPKEKPYSIGPFIGLGAGMLILGAMVGAFAFYNLREKCSKMVRTKRTESTVNTLQEME